MNLKILKQYLIKCSKEKKDISFENLNGYDNDLKKQSKRIILVKKINNK